MQETWVQSLGRENHLEKEMATHSSTLAWKIPWTEEPGEPQSIKSKRVGHDWATSLRNESFLCYFWTFRWERNTSKWFFFFFKMPFLELTAGQSGNCTKIEDAAFSYCEKWALLLAQCPLTSKNLKIWKMYSECFTYTFKMSSISKFLESDFAGYRSSSHSLLFNFRLICPDSAAAGSALQSVIKSTKNGLEGWNCWELIWRKPNTQRFLKIWHVMSMSSHTSV